MRFLDAASTRAALGFPALIAAIEQLFIDGCEVPQRHVHAVSAPDGRPDNTVLIMPAWQVGGCFGLKTVSIAPGNGSLGLPGLHSTYLLFDATTGVPIAMMDGNEITSRRTAAASALAAGKLARVDSSRLLVVGAGRVASLLPKAYRTVLPITEVRVWARQASAASTMVDDLVKEGVDAAVADDLAVACGWADVVSCATLATAPCVQGRWLRPGSHLDLIGSFTPAMREADDAAFAAASVWVDTDEALVKSGELLGPMQRGVFSREDVKGTLADLCRGACVGRRTADERTVFKSVGTALEDLAAAMLVRTSMVSIAEP